MLAAEYKLNSVQFKKTFETGKQIHTEILFIKYLRGQDSFRAAAVVSKKQSKTAIWRNYKRRHIFNALQEVHAEHSDTLNGIWMTIMLKKDSINTPYTDIKSDLEQIIKKLG